jgi:hypothetical protein
VQSGIPQLRQKAPYQQGIISQKTVSVTSTSKLERGVDFFDQ